MEITDGGGFRVIGVHQREINTDAGRCKLRQGGVYVAFYYMNIRLPCPVEGFACQVSQRRGPLKGVHLRPGGPCQVERVQSERGTQLNNGTALVVKYHALVKG